MNFSVIDYTENKSIVETDYSTFVVWHEVDVTKEKQTVDCFHPDFGHYTEFTGGFKFDITVNVKGIDLQIAEDVYILNVQLCKVALKQIEYVISQAAIKAAKEEAYA